MVQGGEKLKGVVRLDTRTLLVRHRNGDPDAFSDLIAEFGSRVKAYLTRSGVDAATRDDLFQEIFVKVHKMAHTYQPERALEPWLFTIAANTLRSYFRKQSVLSRIKKSAREEKKLQPATGEEFACASETVRWLGQELEKLSFSQRQVIVLCCLQDFSQKDAARILDIPLNTVKTHLRRARLQLAKEILRRDAQRGEEVLP